MSNHSRTSPTLVDAVWQLTGFLFGLVLCTFYFVASVINGDAFARLSQRASQKLAAARSRHWKLPKSPEGLLHEFFPLHDGRKLHYVVPSQSGAAGDETADKKANLVIFLHGFPDSWMVWRRLLLSQALQENSTLVAVDLPGYGGSDSFPRYSATVVLGSLGAFILGMRSKYLEHGGKVFIVSHDWGACIAFRLATEAPELADRFILSNSIFPKQVVAYVTNRRSLITRVVSRWSPESENRLSLLGLVREVISASKPLLFQVIRSGYMVVFNLPQVVPNLVGQFGNYWFLRKAYRAAFGRRIPEDSDEAADALASSLGPSLEQCLLPQSSEANHDARYSDTVRHRATAGAWSEQIKYYRQGLFTSKWRKSPDLVQALEDIQTARCGSDVQQAPLSRDTILAPCTIVWAENDEVLDHNVFLHGIENYLADNSQVMLVPGCAHGLPLLTFGAEVLQEVISWATEGEKETLRRSVERRGLEVNITLEK